MITGMKRVTFAVVLMCLLAWTAFAESGKLSFEVASIKPAGPMVPGQIKIGMSVDGGMLRYTNVSLLEVIRNAYRVKEFQIEGPDWLSSTRFDITAKFPEGAKEEQVPEMLQSLLAERFGMTVHNDTKEHAIYALVPGKNGPNLKPAESTPADLSASSGNANARAAVAATPGGGPRTADVNAVAGRPGAMMMMMGPSGMRMKTPSITLAGLAEALSRFSERPVVDQTGIEGRFDFDLEFMPERTAGLRKMGGMPPPPTAPTGDARGPDGGDSAPTIYEAVQRYGLKLEPRKAPMPVLVIDHIEKAPTEN